MFTIDSVTYSIPPSGYLSSEQGFGCTALIGQVADSTGFYILGDTFIRNFYITFNYEYLTVTIHNRPGSTDAGTAGLSTGAIWGIVLGVIFVIAFIAMITWFCLKKQKAKKTSRYVYSGVDTSPLA